MLAARAEKAHRFPNAIGKARLVAPLPVDPSRCLTTGGKIPPTRLFGSEQKQKSKAWKKIMIEGLEEDYVSPFPRMLFSYV